MHRPAEDGSTHTRTAFLVFSPFTSASPGHHRLDFSRVFVRLQDDAAPSSGCAPSLPGGPQTKSRMCCSAAPSLRLIRTPESLAPRTRGLAQYTRASGARTFTSPFSSPPPLLIDSARLHPAAGLRCSPRRAARHLRKDASDIAVLTPIAAAHPRSHTFRTTPGADRQSARVADGARTGELAPAASSD
ncbi:hypothetical protein C8R46DRAFT_1087823 [Mycena filopes]|nr:hypothetical protein C8R46DRAFT_1087823 [Mycena filopes]